ncbi:uncharacterized protein LOC110907196 [Helianthus annuus]|uniref:uncharacterized protein LOC110907196 n=1 Tax=Helianthus annuus TaxID=4232 RepID=UPI000B8F88C6|nr:uncharacterized protein LOC110907196 [Helianthus annuus]
MMLPSSVIKDLEKRLRRFLWNGGTQGPVRTKVAWKDVCMPKEEGGLGIRSIMDVNKTLLPSHIWSLITNRQSLSLGPMDPLIQVESPLRSFITPRVFANAGFSLNNTVADIVAEDGQWLWPQAWYNLYQVLINIDPPQIISNMNDRFSWKDLEEVWILVRKMVDMGSVTDTWVSILQWMELNANSKTMDHIICIILVAPSTYFIWQERNSRLFSQAQRSASVLAKVIIDTVRLRIMRFKFGKDPKQKKILDRWLISENNMNFEPG